MSLPPGQDCWMRLNLSHGSRAELIAYLCLLLKLVTTISCLQVVGINTPAHMCGLQAGDVLVSVQDKVMDRMTHNEVVNIIKGVNGNELKMKIERGDHIIPNIGESFPIEAEEERRRVLCR